MSRFRLTIMRMLSVACALMIFNVTAQGPGSQPPPGILDDSGRDASGSKPGLQFKGFLFLDESGVGVMVPQMTYERWHELESGIDGPQQSYVFRSLDVVGKTSDGRAELQVTLRFSVNATDGRQIPIPLRMGNFHCLSPPDVSGVEEHSITVAPDNGGYVLWVRADKKRDAILRMKVAARVESGTTSSLQFRLPDVPSTVTIDMPGENVTSEIVGRGDEVLQTKKAEGGSSRLVVESGGGTFMLRWGAMRRQDDTSPQLEVDSRVDIRWVSPEDQPIASVQLIVRNLRGPVSQFDVRVPPGAVLLDSPVLGTSGQLVDAPTPSAGDETEPLRFSIPEEEQQQRIDLNLELQLANTQASATAPLILQVPEVVGAIRQRGQIHIQTGTDYRLRWLSRQWIQSIANESTDDLGSSRRYSFRYDRGGLSLPIYLSAKQRRVRLTSTTDILLSESLATIEMTINASGQVSDGRGLNVDFKGWRLRSIVDTETGEELEYFDAGQFQEIEMNSGGAEESAPVRILAERDIDATGEVFQLPLPRIVKVDENQVVQTSTVVVRSAGRSAFVPDLSDSVGLDRFVTTDFGPIQPNVHRFRIRPPDAPAKISGVMVKQTPRIDLASSAVVELISDELRTTVDWTITSLVDLEGRLPIEIPAPRRPRGGVGGTDLLDRGDRESASAGFDSVEDGDAGEQLGRWMVTVEDSAAVLRHIDGIQYELVSDRLTDGTVSIRWWYSQPIDSRPQDESLKWVVLPRPTIADVSMQGPTRVVLRGNQSSNLQVAGSATDDGFLFESLPREPLRVRLTPRAVQQRDISVERAVLRTAIGQNTRHEQLIATVQGGEYFDVGLSAAIRDVSAEAFVDSQPSSIRREDNRLRVALPVDNVAHTVDLRVWIPESSGAWFPVVKPRLQVPIGVGRVYWQIVAPLDSHVLWASPTLGRAMHWKLDEWRLAREPIRSDQLLSEWAGADQPIAMPPGNRYLYVGTEPASFRAVTATRGLLWALVAAFVLLVATVLVYLPQSRNPMSAVVAAILLAGLLAVAPDAAVIAGQFSMIALVLVVVMTSIRALIAPRRTQRVFQPQRGGRMDPSTRSLKPRAAQQVSSVAATKRVAVAAQPVPQGSGDVPPTTEVSS